MKKFFVFTLIVFFSISIISAQKTQINLGVDVSVLDPDGIGPMVYFQYQKKVIPKLYFDFETHYVSSSEEIPSFRSQDGKALAALVLEEDYPFNSPNKEEWFDKGIKQLKTKPKKTMNLTADFNGKHQIFKSEKREFGVSAGLSFSYIEKQDASLILPGQFESIDFKNNGLVLPIIYMIRYYDIGANVKLNYTFFLSEHTGFGFRASFHKLKSSHYSSAGVFYNVRF